MAHRLPQCSGRPQASILCQANRGAASKHVCQEQERILAHEALVSVRSGACLPPSAVLTVIVRRKACPSSSEEIAEVVREKACPSPSEVQTGDV